jgi:streptomycin 6-kinase
MVVIPERFAADTVGREGAVGQAWLDQLPALVEALRRQWHLQVDGPVMHGGLALAVPVLRGDDACVLKVSWMDGSTRTESLALATWDGQGAVRLLEAAPQHGAMLLERLDFTRSLNDISISEAIPVAGELLRRLAVPAPAGIMTSGEWGQEALEMMPQRWAQYGRAVPRQVLDRACGLTAQLSESTDTLLVNYDLHYLDTLASEREPWLVVDPKVVVGEPEFGVAQLFWCRLEDIEAQGGFDVHFRTLVEVAELDAELTRAWTYIRCVDYWLWGLSVGLTYDPVRCDRIIRNLT